MHARPKHRVWPDFVAGRAYRIVVQPFGAAAAREGCTTTLHSNASDLVVQAPKPAEFKKRRVIRMGAHSNPR
jgi:hypothetical protein